MTRSSRIETVADFIELWPSQAELADDIGEPDATIVRMWKYRQRIPAEYDMALVAAAKKRGLPVSFETLAKLRAKDAAA